MSLASATQRGDVPPQAQRFLSTDKGENWLMEDFLKRDIASPVFIKMALPIWLQETRTRWSLQTTF